MSGIDLLLAEILDRRRSEQIAADAGNHEDFCPAQARGHRLVRPFSAKAKIKLLREDRFTRLGKLVAECCQVDIGTSNDGDAGTFCHVYPAGRGGRASLLM